MTKEFLDHALLLTENRLLKLKDELRKEYQAVFEEIDDYVECMENMRHDLNNGNMTYDLGFVAGMINQAGYHV